MLGSDPESARRVRNDLEGSEWFKKTSQGVRESWSSLVDCRSALESCSSD